MSLETKRLRKLLLCLGLVAVVISVTATLDTSRAAARPAPGGGGPIGGPLCGWTALWTCTLPNGSEVTVAGTQCDIRRFERQTGARCALQ